MDLRPNCRGPRPSSDSPHTALLLFKNVVQPSVAQSFLDRLAAKRPAVIGSNIVAGNLVVVANMGDGALVGAIVGAMVGAPVGAADGAIVGAIVGAMVGAPVGAAVGAAVAAITDLVVVSCGGTTWICFATDVDFCESNPGIQVCTFKV